MTWPKPPIAALLDASWTRPGPDVVFAMPRLAARDSACLSILDCRHQRCSFLRSVALSRCRICGDLVGWGSPVKRDPQGEMFDPAWVHTRCDASRVGRALRAASALGSPYRRRR